MRICSALSDYIDACLEPPPSDRADAANQLKKASDRVFSDLFHLLNGLKP